MFNSLTIKRKITAHVNACLLMHLQTLFFAIITQADEEEKNDPCHPLNFMQRK